MRLGAVTSPWQPVGRGCTDAKRCTKPEGPPRRAAPRGTGALGPGGCPAPRLAHLEIDRARRPGTRPRCRGWRWRPFTARWRLEICHRDRRQGGVPPAGPARRAMPRPDWRPVFVTDPSAFPAPPPCDASWPRTHAPMDAPGASGGGRWVRPHTRPPCGGGSRPTPSPGGQPETPGPSEIGMPGGRPAHRPPVDRVRGRGKRVAAEGRAGIFGRPTTQWASTAGPTGCNMR